MSNVKFWILSLIALLAPIQTTIIAMFVLVGFDFITGVWASLKRHEGFSSAKARSTVSKVTIYLIALISGFIAEKYMNLDIIPIVKLIAGAIALVEVTSVVENLNSISGTNMFQELIRRLGSSNLPKDND